MFFFDKKIRQNKRFSCKNLKNPWQLGALSPHPPSLRRLGALLPDPVVIPLCRILGATLYKPMKFCPPPRSFGLATPLAPRRHSFEDTSQRWRAVGYTVLDLTGLEIEPQAFRIDSVIFNNCAITDRLVEKLLKCKKTKLTLP